MSNLLNRDINGMTLEEHILTVSGILVMAIVMIALYTWSPFVLGALAAVTLGLLVRGLAYPMIRYFKEQIRD